MKQTVGRDISKYFYGAYALEGNMNLKPGEANLAHAHTNIARRVMYNHIVGVMASYVSPNPAHRRDTGTKNEKV